MKITRAADRFLGETEYRATCANGLRVLLLPRRGIARKVALLGVDYGSIGVAARAAAGDAPLAFPAGTAHFLEHMMFQKADGDISNAFTRAGASCNASTDYTSTVYSFTCGGRFEENLALLARLVRDLHVDDAEVAREREVIAQELKMYLDTPDVKVYQGLMEALYFANPVRIDIGGTLESIARIDAAGLRRAHEEFYVPANCWLAMTGDLEVEGVFRAVRESWGSQAARAPARLVDAKDPPGVRAERFAATASTASPKALYGIKDPRPPRLGRELFLREAATTLALELVFGRGAPLFTTMYRAGVIDDSFACSYTCHPTHAFTVIGGDTDDPERLRGMIVDGIRAARKRGIHKRDFERVKRKYLGRMLQRLDDAEAAAYLVLGYAMSGVDLMDFAGLFRHVTRNVCVERLEEHLGGHPAAYAVVGGKPEARNSKSE